MRKGVTKYFKSVANTRWNPKKMKFIRITDPYVLRKKVHRFSRSWVRCFTILPFILIFIVMLGMSFYSISGKRVPLDKDTTSFTLDPLINKNASRPVIWIQNLLNHRKANEMKHLIQQAEMEIKCNGTDNINLSTEVDPNCVRSIKPIEKELRECDSSSKTLIGPIYVSANLLNISTEDVLNISFPIAQNGAWKPENCTQKYQIGIIIPYRDRKSHLLQLLYYLHPMLKRQQLNYHIFVVEQLGDGIFNKGMIMNAAADTIIRYNLMSGSLDYMCFIFHDVDMLPEDDRNLYTCSNHPRHLSVAVNEFNYKLPYYELVGGVFEISVKNFLKVNGYSNLFWGWGGEDDDMGYRLDQTSLPISRPAPSVGRYTMIKHVKRSPLAYKVRSVLLRTSKKRYKIDGLNSLEHKLINITNCRLYTNILVDVGTPPKSIMDVELGNEDKRIPKTKQSHHQKY